MKITVSNTSKIVNLNGVTARVWEGQSDTGIPVICFISRIAIDANVKEHVQQFEAELKEVSAPSVEAQSFPTKMII